MKRSTALMIRAHVVFLLAVWSSLGTVTLACYEHGGYAIVTGYISVFFAFMAGIEYKRADEEYEKTNKE